MELTNGSSKDNTKRDGRRGPRARIIGRVKIGRSTPFDCAVRSDPSRERGVMNARAETRVAYRIENSTEYARMRQEKGEQRAIDGIMHLHQTRSCEIHKKHLSLGPEIASFVLSTEIVSVAFDTSQDATMISVLTLPYLQRVVHLTS